MHDQKILLKSFGSAENVTQLTYQKFFMDPEKKDKHTTWYLKYTLLNQNWIVRTKSFNKTAKYIVQFSSRTFGRSPHFIKAVFSVYSLILFSCYMIYFIAVIIGYKLGLVRITKYPDYRQRRWYPGKNHRGGYQYKNNWIFKKK